MKHALAIAALLAIAGCATTAHDERPASKIQTVVAADYKQLAVCVFADLEQTYPAGIKLFDYEGMGRARVWAEVTRCGLFGCLDPMLVWELNFYRAADNRVRVEAWGMYTFSGVTPYVEKTWAAVRDCSKPSD